jgi:DNA-directed RNA polymerase subunit RPC12/RpoP
MSTEIERAREWRRNTHAGLNAFVSPKSLKRCDNCGSENIMKIKRYNAKNIVAGRTHYRCNKCGHDFEIRQPVLKFKVWT